MSAGAVIIHRQNKYINLFCQYGAIQPEHAIIPEDVGIRTNYIFNRMCDHGIFVPCGNGAYYLDIKAAAYFRTARRKRALVILALFFAIYLLCLYYGIR